jgi:tRNA pseudouridine synthase 10
MTHPVDPAVIDALARKVIALRTEFRFDSFWLGTRVTGVGGAAEAVELKREVNRRVGELVERLAPELTARLQSPEVRITLNYPAGTIEPRITPLLIYGRYRKLSREIPQSRWPCRWCGGQGCERCGGTGKRFQRTVEELLAAPILALSGAEASKLHSIGREDVDARMLGRGRPFILECRNPRRRDVDLAAIETQVNRDHAADMAVEELRFVDKALRDRLRFFAPDKSYRARVHCLVPAARDAVEALAALRDVQLTQETPRRVLHRRPNRVRLRSVRECAIEVPAPGPQVEFFHITLRTESGTYIKEFISGDEGRTRPSVGGLLGVPCDCVELDVLEVHCDPLREMPATGQDTEETGAEEG